MHVAVIGATGVLGRNVMRYLVARDHTVHVVARAPTNVPNHPNVKIFRGDILEPDTLAPAVIGCDTVMHLATAIPKRGQPADWDRNTKIRTTGTANLLIAARDAGVRKYIQQSIAFIYADARDEFINESFPLAAPTSITGPVFEMEKQVQGSELDWIILRGGLFYGPGTDRMFEWNELAMTGQLVIPDDGSAFIALIHVEDMAAAVVRAAEYATHNSVFNVVDDRPVTFRELFTFISQSHGAGIPTTGNASIFPSLRISNSRIKTALRWSPRYRSYRDGWITGASDKTATKEDTK